MKINKNWLQILKRKLKGIGLLELMLALAIIAVLLVMATRYYMSASLNSRINQTGDALTSLPAAGECWAGSASNSSYPGTYQGLNLYTVAYTDKCYPSSLVSKSDTSTGTTQKIVTPYGDLTVTAEANSLTVVVSSQVGTSTIPTNELQLLAGKICPRNFSIETGATSFTYEAVTQQCS